MTYKKASKKDLMATIDWLLSVDADAYPTVSSAELIEQVERWRKGLEFYSSAGARRDHGAAWCHDCHKMDSARIAAMEAEIRQRSH
jgi:hypothetical protein